MTVTIEKCIDHRFLLHHLSVSLLSSCSNEEFNVRWNSCTLWLCCSWCSFRHLMRRFWNQTFTWASVNRSAWARYSLSGPTIYCWRANSPSRRSSCSAVKIVLTLFTLPPPPELELELPFFVEPSWPADMRNRHEEFLSVECGRFVT